MCVQALVLWAYLLPGLLRAGEPERIVFAPHPRLAYTASELKAWRDDPKRQGEIARLQARADRLLKKGLFVPKKGGDWIFYYACPKDNARLVPKDMLNHQCPRCKKIYSDERTIAAYRTVLQDRLNRDCYDLALAYALTGNKAYAQAVRDALMELVVVYPTLERHDRWGRKGILAVVGGRRYCQHLTEGVGVMKLAEAFDLIADSLSNDDYRKIAQDFLGKTAREIRKFNRLGFVGGRNNHQTWFNAAYMKVGVAIGDEELVRGSMTGSHGLEWQLRHSVTQDGLWYEGTMDYHIYALCALMQHLDAARRVGWTLAADKRLKSMWTGPLQLAWPNGAIPAVHDSNPSNINRLKAPNAWAAKYFDDPIFAEPAGPSKQKQAAAARLPSVVLKGVGMAILRRGPGKGTVSAMIDYGIHGGHHGHPDKLNLMLYALGRELMPDPGRISYSVPEWKSWCRTTVAHNTVVINEKDQEPDNGELLFFEETKDYTVCVAGSAKAYPGRKPRRAVLLHERFLVDLFSVRAKRKAVIDLAAHCRGKLKTKLAMTPAPAKVFGGKNGYQHLEGVKRAKSARPVVFDFAVDNRRFVRLHCLGKDRERLLTAVGIGTSLHEKVPVLIRRRRAKSTLFAAVYDLSGDGTAVTNMSLGRIRRGRKRLPLWDAASLSFVNGKVRWTITIDFRDQADPPCRVHRKTLNPIRGGRR